MRKEFTIEPFEGGFSLACWPDFPLGQARCLAVTAASWVRDALEEGAVIRWPNHVTLAGERVCPLECRATEAGELRFTFRPVPGVDGESFRRAVTDAAGEALAGYPENRSALIQRYCEHCDTVMKFVKTVYRGVPVYGFAFAVDKHGGLMIMTQESRTVITVYGGEVTPADRDDGPESPAPPNRSGF